jgi:hypothetical protein
MPGPRTNAAFYAAPVSEFLAASNEEAYAPLAAPKGYTLAPEQLSAWHLQLPALRAALRGLARVPQEQGPVPFGDEAAPAPWIHLKFDIPRLESGAEEDMGRIEISPFGLHWPTLDKDLSFAGILEGRYGQR